MRTALFPADDPGTPSLQALGVSSHILLPSDVPLTINPLLLPHNLPLMAIVSENVSETRMGAFVQEDSYAVPRTGTRHIHHVQPQSALSVVIIAIAVAAVSAILLVLSVLFPAVSWKGLQQPTPSLTTEAENAVSMEQTEASTKVAKPSDDSHEEEAVLAGSQPPHPRRQAILIQLCVFFVLADFGWASESTFFAGEVQKAGLGQWYTGLNLGSSAILGIPSCLVATWLLGFVFPPDLLMVSILSLSLTTSMLGLSNLFGSAAGFAVFSLTWRVLQGYGVVVVEQCCLTILMRLYPMASEFGSITGMLGGLRALTALASPPIGGLLYPVGGFTLPFLIDAAVSVVAAVVLVFTLRKESGMRQVDKQNVTMLSIVRIPTVQGLMLASFMGAFTMMTLGPIWQPWLGTRPLAFTPARISGCMVLIPIAYALSSVLAGPIIKRIGNITTIVASLLLNSVIFLFVGSPPVILPMLRPHPALPYVISLVWGLLAGVGGPAGASLIVRVFTDNGLDIEATAAPYSSLCVVLPMLAAITASVTSGALVDHFGPATAAFAVGCFGIVGALIVALYIRAYAGVKIVD